MTVTRRVSSEEIPAALSPRVSFGARAVKGVEVAQVGELRRNSIHSCTPGLQKSVPRPDVASIADEPSAKGSTPDLIHPSTGCRFHPKHPRVLEKCRGQMPRLVEFVPSNFVPRFPYGE